MRKDGAHAGKGGSNMILYCILLNWLAKLAMQISQSLIRVRKEEFAVFTSSWFPQEVEDKYVHNAHNMI